MCSSSYGIRPATASLTANAAQWRRITFGCAALDRLTRNGLPVRGLTELSGCAGAGKSQLCMQLALMVQLPVDLGGLGGAAVYICTEGAFASGRLLELIESVRSQFGSRMYDHPFASGVLLDHLSDATALRRCVRTDLPRLMCNRNDVRLVVIDSMAGVFRTETDDIRQRAHHMREVAAGLLDLSERYGCAVVCVNQVRAELFGMTMHHHHSRTIGPANQNTDKIRFQFISDSFCFPIGHCNLSRSHRL